MIAHQCPPVQPVRDPPDTGARHSGTGLQCCAHERCQREAGPNPGAFADTV